MNPLNSKEWKAANWLTVLYCLLISVSLIYVFVHGSCKESATENKIIGTAQIVQINLLAAPFAEDSTSNDSNAIRQKRNKVIIGYLRFEYDNCIDSVKLSQLENMLISYSTKDLGTFFQDRKIAVKSYFFLNGSQAYLEVILWCLIGVLVSLIFYVSSATTVANKDKTVGNVDTGAFDPAEISNQVAKMFYAPICALVLVLGYNLFTEKMIDISAGKGLLLFSFMCGFFSGRVMKFIDKLKELILPIGGDDTQNQKKSEGGNTINNGDKTSEIIVNVGLDQAFPKQELSKTINEAGFATADVKLHPMDGGADIMLSKPAEGKPNIFSGTKVPFGKYTLTATMTFESGTEKSDLIKEQEIEIKEASTTVDILLNERA